jgi:1-acyl-sn-glycerol-3-phosphate acyltransferase
LKAIRGYLALIVLFVFLILADPVQRLVIAPLSRLFPDKKVAILGRWLHFMRGVAVSPVVYIGGARFATPPAIPGGEGVLILMNHQSVFDIPLVVESLPKNTFPRFVTRSRYFRGIPLVSHLLRLYQYPRVDPQANANEMKKSLVQLRDAARSAEVPLCIYPEGTRTRDGEIGPFRPRGLRLMLKQRPWKVYVLVGDGYWRTAKLKDFARGMSDLRGRVELAGVFDWTDPSQDSEEFIAQVRQAMIDRLGEMRQMAPV